MQGRAGEEGGPTSGAGPTLRPGRAEGAGGRAPLTRLSFVFPQKTSTPGRSSVEDSPSEARGPRALPSPSLLAPAARAPAWVRSVPGTSGTAQGRPQHRPPSDTAAPCRSPTSWRAAGPRGAPAAPESGLLSLRGGATAAGAPRCRLAAPGRRAEPSPLPAPPRPPRPGRPRLWPAAASRPWARLGDPPDLACPRRAAACPCRRSTCCQWTRPHPRRAARPRPRPRPRPSWAVAGACSAAALSRACARAGRASGSAGARRMRAGRARPWTS